MKLVIIYSFLTLLSSCVPSMQTGPNPHSIEFDNASFKIIAEYFISNKDEANFDIEKIPNNIPENIAKLMNEIGFLEFRNFGSYKVFFCGYGVVGKGWGFILGDFNSQEIEQPPVIKYNSQQLYLSFLERLEGNWYRFAAS